MKLIRDRHRGIVAGYGFIDFRNHETAKFVLETLNGKPIGEHGLYGLQSADTESLCEEGIICLFVP